MTQMNKTGKTLPEKKFRAGAVSATVWKNANEKDGTAYEFFSVSLERGYKDKEGQWQSTTSLRTADLPRAALVLQEAFKYIVLSNNQTEAAAA